MNKLTIKSVFVYRPDFSFDQMLNEISAEYRFTDYFKIKAGRFLTPLSPMNTYYYAPVNHSATLPIIITHHEFFPIHIDALSLEGTIGDNIKFNYKAFAGGFNNTLWLKTGSLKLFGYETDYLVMTDSTTEKDSNNDIWHFAGGLHGSISFQNYFTIGYSLFRAEETVEMTDEMTGLTTTIIVDKLSQGINFKLNVSTLQLIGEVWKTEVEFMSLGDKDETKGAFFELSSSFGKLTPYARYEYYESRIEYSRYTAGISYKPFYEAVFKLEYMHYDYEPRKLNGIIGTVIISF